MTNDEYFGGEEKLADITIEGDGPGSPIRIHDTEVWIFTSEQLHERDLYYQAEALRGAARKIYNGAGSPEQALYNEGAAPWLENLALTLLHDRKLLFAIDAEELIRGMESNISPEET